MLFRFVRSVSRYCVGPEDIFGQNPLRDSEFPEPRLWIRAVFFSMRTQIRIQLLSQCTVDPDPALKNFVKNFLMKSLLQLKKDQSKVKNYQYGLVQIYSSSISFHFCCGYLSIFSPGSRSKRENECGSGSTALSRAIYGSCLLRLRIQERRNLKRYRYQYCWIDLLKGAQITKILTFAP